MRQLIPAALALLLLLPGCRPTPKRSPEAKARVDARQKLRSGMTEAEVVAMLGQPVQFRPGNGRKDDVAVYKVGDGTVTVYFYNNHLTRVVSSREPVNR